MKSCFLSKNIVFLLFIAGLLLCCAAFPLFSEESEIEKPAGVRDFFKKISWFAEASVLFFPEDNGLNSDPMPVLPSPGMGTSFPFTNMFRMELTLDLYFTHYGFCDTLNRAIPNAIENRTARVAGSILGLQAALHYDITHFMTVRAFAGPAADLRIIIMAANLTEGLDDLAAIREEVDLVRDYFWSSGRWFMPVMGLGADFTLNPRFRMGIDLRVWAPAYRLWTNEDLPAIEGWRFGPGLRLTIR